MGLFGLFGNSSNNQPFIYLEDALIQDEAELLVTTGLKLLDVDWAIFEGHPICKYEKTADWLFDLKASSYKCLKKEMVSAELLFRVAEDKGSADAAFLLGVIYEHGIGKTEQNLEEANTHYELAESRGCKLVEIINLLRVHHKLPSGLEITPQEDLALGMLSVCSFDDIHGQKIREMISPELSEHENTLLLQISTYLLYFYAEKEYPASLCFACIYSGNYKEFVRNGKIHKYSAVKGNDCMMDLNKRLKKLALMGDRRTIGVCQSVGLKFYD